MPEDIAKDAYQPGLLDIAIGPEFSANHQIFLSYTAVRTTPARQSEYATCLVGGSLKENKLSIEKRLCVPPWYPVPNQFGGALAIDNHNTLFMTVGDRGWRNAAQDVHSTLGKVIRISSRDFKAPYMNPYRRDNPLVWSLGHRNSQGLYFDRDSGLLYESEHGPKGGDEINLIHRGVNYGWPIISYGREYDTNAVIGEGGQKKGYAQPLYYYGPSTAPSALLVYRGAMFPEWRGSLFVTSLAGFQLNHLVMNQGRVTGEERYLGYLQSRLRDIKEAPDGSLYVLSEDGFILRLYR